MKTRASSIGLHAACPASLDVGDVVINSPSPEAALGTAVHDYLAAEIGGHVNAAYVSADQADDLRMLTAIGMRCWRKLERYFPAPSVERYLEATIGPLTLTGHADVYSLELQPTDGLGEVRILDWKTGREDADHDDQLRAYALLGLENNADAESASVALVRLRDQTVDWGHYTRDELTGWWSRLSERLLREKRDYAPGRHCGYCPRSATCPARTAMLEQAVTAVIGSDVAAGVVVGPTELAILLDRVKLVEKCCATARDLVRAAVIEAGGILETADGRQLEIVDQERAKIDVEAGIGVLNEAIGSETVLSLLKIGKGDVEKAAGATASRGQKTRAVKELMDRLEQVGAIKVETIERLEVRRSNASNPRIENRHSA